MLPKEIFFLCGLLIYAIYATSKGWYACRHHKQAYKLSPEYFLLGAFVMGDAFVLGIFWTGVAGLILLLQDWLLFWLIWSVFWVVRSAGETIYWFNQQFSTINRNPPHNLPWTSVFHDDSVWFIYQVICQCVMVAAILMSIYFATLWIRTI